MVFRAQGRHEFGPTKSAPWPPPFLYAIRTRSWDVIRRERGSLQEKRCGTRASVFRRLVCVSVFDDDQTTRETLFMFVCVESTQPLSELEEEVEGQSSTVPVLTGSPTRVEYGGSSSSTDLALLPSTAVSMSVKDMAQPGVSSTAVQLFQPWWSWISRFVQSKAGDFERLVESQHAWIRCKIPSWPKKFTETIEQIS